MARSRQDHVLQELRTRIRRIEGGENVRQTVLPFGISALDEHLSSGGLLNGAIHEIAGAEFGAIHGAAAALFAAGILARAEGMVLWCLRAHDLFAPALAGAGLHPDRVIYVEAGDETTMLLVLEEGLRHGGLAGVVGELSRLPMAASRRLQLAAEAKGVLGLIVRRWRTITAAQEFERPTASASRWRIAGLPSSPLPTAGVGRARWRVELVRCRGGTPNTWELEACDAQGYLAMPAVVADRSAATAGRRIRAASG
jgi:protein ImuA